MSQRVLTIPNTSGNTLIVSGTEIMEIPAGHVRSAEAHVPSFATKPDITITIYSDESIPYNPYPEPEEGEADVSNPGVTFVPWSIEYRPKEAPDEGDRIIISAANTNPGVSSAARVVCSYLAIGEPSEKIGRASCRERVLMPV